MERIIEIVLVGDIREIYPIKAEFKKCRYEVAVVSGGEPIEYICDLILRAKLGVITVGIPYTVLNKEIGGALAKATANDLKTIFIPTLENLTPEIIVGEFENPTNYCIKAKDYMQYIHKKEEAIEKNNIPFNKLEDMISFLLNRVGYENPYHETSNIISSDPDKLLSMNLKDMVDGFPIETSSISFKEAANLNDSGWDCFELDDFNNALKYFHRAIEIFPDFPLAWNNIGLCYFRLNRFEDSLNSFIKAIKLSPTFAKSYVNIAYLYLDLKKDNAKADEWFSRAKSIIEKKQNVQL